MSGGGAPAAAPEGGGFGPGPAAPPPGPHGRLLAAHSPRFVAAWRSVFCDVYRWRREGRFAVVPSLFGSPVRSYLPGLNYADLTAAEARALARETAGRPFNIRALEAPRGEPARGSPVVLRLDLAAFGHDREAIWKRALNGAARRAVRRARKAGLGVAEESGPAALDGFAGMLAETLTRHGAPMMPAALFESLVRVLGARVLTVRGPAGEVLASLLWVRDGPLAWMPWAGMKLRAPAPGNLLFWTLVEQALAERADVVDFGRAAAGGGNCRFKRGFGAAPVPVLWLSDRRADLYRRYAAAQTLWRALPRALTGRLGPRLCRYLADY